MKPFSIPPDAEFAAYRDLIPRLWWNVYIGCLQQGFDQKQAFALLMTYILSQNTQGIRPDTMNGPELDKPE